MWFVIDLIILAIILLCTFLGYKKGLIGVVFKIISFFIAILLAFILSGPISNWIMEIETKEVEKKDINNTSQIIVDYINKQTTEVKNAGIKSIAKQITETAIRVIVMIVIYIITKIILFFFRKLAEALSELPLIKQFNKLGGTIYGVLKGLLIVYVILATLSLLAPMISNGSLFEMINSSIIGSFMYNNNLLLNILL